jgi:stalled ribosome rescue protein Dom34
MKKVGIWLDKEKAYVVTLENDTESLVTIDSNIEHFHVHGGSGTRIKGGPQDVIQDSKYLEREKHQLKRYFKNIISKIRNVDALVIFGPAETNEKFSKELYENYKRLSSKIKGVKKVDSITDNQKKAWVRKFFNQTKHYII